jgi:hypothetical protein
MYPCDGLKMNIHAIVFPEWLVILHTDPESASESFSFANEFHGTPLGAWLNLASVSHLL